MNCPKCSAEVIPALAERSGGYCAACDLMSTAEVMAELGCGRGALWNARRRGTLKAYSRVIGPNRTWFRRSDVEKLKR